MIVSRLHPLEEVEIYLRAGHYNIDSGDKPVFLLKHFQPDNNGRLIIAGQGRRIFTLFMPSASEDFSYNI